MCGRYNLVDHEGVRRLFAGIGMPLYPQDSLRFSPDISPASRISILRERDGQKEVADALWWLLLDPETGKPTRYTSFNSRADKLNQPRALAYHPYRESRCIIPATAFIEGLGDGKTYHKIELVDQAIAFGGLYREYFNKQTGEVYTGASIITLGGHPAWQNIHADSMPLMLPMEQSVLNEWLDPNVKDVSRFESLLLPSIRSRQRITKIGKVSKWNAIEEPFEISPDDVKGAN